MGGEQCRTEADLGQDIKDSIGYYFIIHCELPDTVCSSPDSEEGIISS
jgi:hypothetical protein